MKFRSSEGISYLCGDLCRGINFRICHSLYRVAIKLRTEENAKIIRLTPPTITIVMKLSYADGM